MKRLIGTAMGVLILSGAAVADRAPAQGKSKKNGHQERSAVTASDTSVGVQVVFGSRDVTILRTHYAPRYRGLPPGLQKKVARGGQLPPGWQKKFEPFPVELERQLPPLPRDHRRGVIDGHAVIYNSRTNVIVDIAVLF